MGVRKILGLAAGLILTVSIFTVGYSFAKEFPLKEGTSCTTEKCHAKMTEKEYVHGALEDGSCTDCHEMEDEGVHRFNFSSEGKELCMGCHEDILEGKHVHSAFEDGTCTDCHDPHASDYPNHLVANPRGELCYTCHDGAGFEGASVHKPVADGECVSCHSPHASDQEYQLKASVPDLCFGCHGEEKGKGKRKVKVASSLKKLYENQDLPLHPPFADGECLECHNPHSSGNPILLASKGPVTNFASYDEGNYQLCFNCHEDLRDSLSQTKAPGETNFRNGGTNLHYLHVVEKGRTCRTCHDPHGTKNEKLIRNLIPFGRKSLRMRYSITETGGSCAPPCHFQKKYDRENPVVNKR